MGKFFISAMAMQRESAQTVIKCCKTIGVKMVTGGPLFTMKHEQFPDVDHFILNEAEKTLKSFCWTWYKVRYDTFTRLTNFQISITPPSHVMAFGGFKNV